MYCRASRTARGRRSSAPGSWLRWAWPRRHARSSNCALRCQASRRRHRRRRLAGSSSRGQAARRRERQQLRRGRPAQAQAQAQAPRALRCRSALLPLLRSPARPPCWACWARCLGSPPSAACSCPPYSACWRGSRCSQSCPQVGGRADGRVGGWVLEGRGVEGRGVEGWGGWMAGRTSKCFYVCSGVRRAGAIDMRLWGSRARMQRGENRTRGGWAGAAGHLRS